MVSLVLSSMSKIFADELPADREISSIPVLLNETAAFQLAVFADYEGEFTVKSFCGSPCRRSIYLIKDVPVGKACFEDFDAYFLHRSSGMYPDVLVPVADGGTVKLEKGKWYSFFVEFCFESGAGGNVDISLELLNGDEIAAKGSITAEVTPVSLPEQTLVHTSWFHCDGIAQYYGLEMFSDEYWKACENFVHTAFEHGINLLLTPVFTPPLDTAVGGERLTAQLVDVTVNNGVYSFGFDKLDRWVDMCDRIGIKYFEISHFYTQWGAEHAPKVMALVDGEYKRIFGWETDASGEEYTDFLKAFAKAFIPYLEKKGIKERCYLHVSDEPNDEQFATYSEHASLLHEIFPGFKMIDALSHYEFYESGAVKTPVPDLYSLEKFYGKVPELWTYYCCGHGRRNITNRLIAMPGQRTRVLGAQLYKYNCKGFLQWGYNFYNTQYSVSPIDPYKITDAGNAFPAGDAFVVYPAPDYHDRPYCSLRLKQFYEGFQDMRALQLLEKLAGREKALQILEKDIEEFTIYEYPHSIEWMLEMRSNVNKEILKYSEA